MNYQQLLAAGMLFFSTSLLCLNMINEKKTKDATANGEPYDKDCNPIINLKIFIELIAVVYIVVFLVLALKNF